MIGDYIAFGDLVLNGGTTKYNAVGQTGTYYTVTRAGGLASLPRPRLTITQLVGTAGAVLGDADDDTRLITLEGEIHAPTHGLLLEELSRFKYNLSVQRATQWFYWTPVGLAARKIQALLQNDGAVTLDAEDDCTALFRLEFLCFNPYFRSTDDNEVVGVLGSTGDTISLTNHGDAYSEPIIKIKPTATKTGGYAYRRWLAIYNRVARALTNYPLEVTTAAGTGFDHATIVAAGKAQADGDDLLVEVDGVEVDRWLNGPNTATCKIWANLTFQAGQSSALAETFAADAEVSSITVVSATTFPTSGTLYNPTSGEAFTYTGKDNSLNRFTGVTRAAKGTTAAQNTLGQTIWWVEHDVWLLYGNASATVPTVDDTVKPIFELDHSTNTSWVYETFRNDSEGRSGAWSYEQVIRNPDFYGTDHGGYTVGDYTELGIATAGMTEGYEVKGRFKVYNPCGITNANFTNGEKNCYNVVSSNWAAAIESSLNGSTWTTEYSIPTPVADGQWEAWTRDEALTAGSLYVATSLAADHYAPHYLEAGDCSLTINSSNTPIVVLGSEQGAYPLDLILTVVLGGDDQESIQLQFMMALDQELEIDCENRTVTYLKENGNQFQALTLLSPALRNYWARLPGHWDGGETVLLRADETGLNGMTITVTYPDTYL